MTQKPNIKKGLLIVLGMILLGALMLSYRDSSLFRAAIVGNVNVSGTPGDGWSPLESGAPCADRGNSVLRVSGAGASFDWSVSPGDYNVLRVPGTTATANHFSGVPGEMEFVAPSQSGPTRLPSVFYVQAVPAGAVGGGQVFTVNLAPACVEQLDFITPNPGSPATPQNGQVQISAIRATLSNGVTYDYTQSQIGNLELNFVQNPGAKPVGTLIQVPFDHPDLEINMSTGGNNIAPKHVPATPGQVQPMANGGANTFNLTSNGTSAGTAVSVNQSSLEVYADNAGAVGRFMVPSVDYIFHDELNLAGVFDSIELINGNSGNVWVYYNYYEQGAVVTATRPLTIPGSVCQNLQTSLYQGRGQGFYVPRTGVTPATGSVSTPISRPYNKLRIVNPVSNGSTFGSQAFSLEFNAVPGLSARAALVSRSANNAYTVNFRDEGQNDQAGTASNLAYAINTTLGNGSPLIAYQTGETIVLNSLEAGSHTNHYTCVLDDVFALNPCFTGGADAVPSDPNASPVVAPPIAIDPVINQGDTKVVYSRGGVGNLTWRSSDSSVLNVAALSDTDTVAPEEQLGHDNLLFSANMDAQDFTATTGTNFFNTANCAFTDAGTAANPTRSLQSCDVSISIPVTYHFNSIGYPITIVPNTGNPIQGRVQGNGQMTATLTGTATLSAASGGFIEITGTMTGSVGGDATGGVAGLVHAQVTVRPFTETSLDTSQVQIGAITGTLVAGDSLIPTNRSPSQQGSVVTNFAVLTGLRPGKATLFVTDGSGCTSPLEVSVLPQELTISFADPNQNPVIEPGDSIQLKALTGPLAGEQKDVTSQAQWESDNSDVLTVSATGRVTALHSGTANITARFDSNVAETGTLNSKGLLTIKVSKLTGLTLSLDQSTINLLPPAEKAKAFSSAVVMINKSSAAGYTLKLQGQTFAINLPVSPTGYATEQQRVSAIASALVTAIQANTAANALVTATASTQVPGVIVLVPTALNPSASVDVSTTAPASGITLLPSVAQAINVPVTESYGLQLIGSFDSGLTRPMNFAEVNWVASPVNRLNDNALDSGRLERGDASGQSSVYAEFTNPDGIVVRSNSIAVNVPSGPVIDYARVIGSGSLQKGGRVNLQVAVSDIDTIADIQKIEVVLARSGAATVDAINADPGAVFFTARTFPNEVTIAASSNPAEVTTTSGSAPAATPAAPNYRTYDIPFEIPVDANLFDGNYKLLITIADVAGHTAKQVMPVYIGKVASGDVNADGKITMLDVILAFQIVAGKIQGTAQQLEAANMDGLGNVTMIDVLFLFRKATSGA